MNQVGSGKDSEVFLTNSTIIHDYAKLRRRLRNDESFVNVIDQYRADMLSAKIPIEKFNATHSNVRIAVGNENYNISCFIGPPPY